MEHFGGNDYVFTTGEIPQCATDDLFAAAIGIAIGGIKEIYAAFQPRLIMGRLLSSGSVHA